MCNNKTSVLVVDDDPDLVSMMPVTVFAFAATGVPHFEHCPKDLWIWSCLRFASLTWMVWTSWRRYEALHQKQRSWY